MTVQRTVLEVDLKPLIGSRFQPTGFPDLGAAEFQSSDGDQALLVESAQSMANRLETTTWDDARHDQVAELTGLPFVRVVDPSGAFLSSSRLEAHRLASAYIVDGTVDGVKGDTWLPQRLGLAVGKPLDHRAIARACFELDPLSLLHGVFFARKWAWQPKIARAVTGFIEARHVRPAVSGGVKRDVVHNEADKESKRSTGEGYSSVPYHRVEYTAETITAFFAIDHAQIRSYGLSEPATALLEALVDFEIGTLLDGGLRLRTACDLTLHDVRRGQLPDAREAAARVAKLTAECANELGPIVEVTWSGGGK